MLSEIVWQLLKSGLQSKVDYDCVRLACILLVFFVIAEHAQEVPTFHDFWFQRSSNHEK